jgi:hypothetical protein
MMEGLNSSMIYCKNVCKYYNVHHPHNKKGKCLQEHKEEEEGKKSILGIKWVFNTTSIIFATYYNKFKLLYLLLCIIVFSFLKLVSILKRITMINNKFVLGNIS